MKLHRRVALALTPGLLIGSLVVVGSTAPAGSAVPPSAQNGAAAVAVEWQRIAVRTVYTEGATPIPSGALYLAFASLAVHDAATLATKRGNTSAVAAVATAAHRVLAEYFPASKGNLDADLTRSLAAVPDGPAENKGVRIGRRAARDMIASRVGDGRGDASIVYQKAPGIGVWQPAPGGAMALPWLGFVRPVVLDAPVALDGPDPVGSAAYAADYEEVRLLGSTDSTLRTAEQTAISQFFVANAVLMHHNALCAAVETEPLGLLATTRLFAQAHAASADTLIQSWRWKFDLGFWRPFQAIATLDDGNPATTPQPGWTPLVPNPAYSDYTSGHAAATSSVMEVIRATLGDDTALVLRAGNVTRSYSSLTALEHDALNARIWGGLHFRDAMEDGYLLGHETAKRVMAEIR